MSLGMRVASGELSMISVSFIAGSANSTAAFALSYFAPSMMFAQWIRSRSGAMFIPKLVEAMWAMNPVQEM